jgi:hypothetical protein
VEYLRESEVKGVGVLWRGRRILTSSIKGSWVHMIWGKECDLCVLGLVGF